MSKLHEMSFLDALLYLLYKAIYTFERLNTYNRTYLLTYPYESMY